MKRKNLTVFTDGSCAGNGSKNAIGGIGIHFPHGELSDISKPYNLGLCTNQKTELYAILYAFRYIKKYLNINDYKIIIKTDSEYSINCITKWVQGWIKNGWYTKSKTLVANRNLIEPLFNYYQKYDITFMHVDAHTGLNDKDSIANAVADQLATDATKKLYKPIIQSRSTAVKKPSSMAVKKPHSMAVKNQIIQPRRSKKYTADDILVELI